MNRGKKLAFPAMVLFVLFMTKPGEVKAQEFNAGVFGGLSTAQVDRDGFGGYTKLGLGAGAFVNREFSDNLYWQIELRYSARGSYYFNSLVVEDLQKTRFRYIELPLLLHYLYQGQYQFEIGVSPDVLIDFAAWDINSQVPQEEPMGGNRRFGLNALAGFQYWFTDNLGVGLRFSYSIIPYALREGASVRYRDSGYFHNVLALTAAWKIKHP